MKKLFTLCVLMALVCVKSWGQSAGFNTSYTVMSLNGGANTYYCMPNNGQSCGSNPSLDGASLGTFTIGTNTLVLKGAQHNVYKCGGADITATNLNYRVYKTGTTPGTFTSTGIGYSSGNANGCGGQDQQWQDVAKTINVLSGLTPGSYTLEIYSDEATTLGTQYLSNSNANYKATFTVAAASGTPVLLYSGTNVAGGTYYATLGAAFSAVNAGTYTGSLHILLYGSTTETASDILNASGTGSASYTALDIKPDAGAAVTVSGTIAGALVDLNGADNITINGLNTNSNSLTISNLSTSSSASTIRFIGDATSNTVTNSTLLGSTGAATSGLGTVYFSTGTTVGNIGNVISNNNIGPAGSNLPLNAIYSLGTSTSVPNTVTVTGNNIYDFFNASLATAALYLTTGSTGWTISNNRIYQTATRTYTTANTHYGINVLTGSGYTISGNTIGYASSTATGTYNIVGNTVALSGFPSSYSVTGTANATRFVAINAAFTASGTNSVIQSNTIAGFALYTSSGATTTNGVWCGIALTSGNATIGGASSSLGNTIGATSGTGSIYTVTTTTGGLTAGIYATSTNTVTIQSNTIGAIDAMGTTAAITQSVNGINTAGTAGNFDISGNTIGNSTNPNIRTGNLYTGTITTLSNVGTTFGTVTATSLFNGILNAASGTVTIGSTTLPNTIRNASINSSSASTVFRGIQTSSGTITITGNTITNLTSPAAFTTYTSGGLAGLGIYLTGGTSPVITGNTISNLSLTYTGTSGTTMAGISYTTPSTSITITRNRIYGLSNASTSTTTTTPGTAAGIFIRDGLGVTANINNNMISLGNAQTTNTSFIGIWAQYTSSSTTTLKIYHNSVNIEGTVTSGAQPSFGFYRGDFSTTAVTVYTVDIKNNIFSNTRSGGTGKHYAIANNYGATASATGWGSNASNYNVLNGTAATIGYWSTDKTFATWQTASAGDATNNSYSGITLTFLASATGDLHLNMGTTATPIESGGTTGLGITTDYDGDARPGPSGSVNGGAIAPDLGADEFDGKPVKPGFSNVTVTPTSSCTVVSHVVSATITPNSGTTSSAVITYNNGSSGTVTMTNTSGNVWTGTIPAGTAGTTVTWSITATNSGGFASTYIGTSYTDAPLTGVSATVTPSASAICTGSPVTLTGVFGKNGGTGTIGSGTSSISSSTAVGAAYGSYWGNGHAQILVLASELTSAGFTAGNLTGISFNISALGSPTSLTNYTIKIGATTATAITTFQSPTFTTVYTAASYTPVLGANTHTFSTAYTWDGTSNLVIDYCFANGVTGSTSAVNTYTVTSFGSFVNYNADGSISNVCGTTTVSNASSNRPNFTLTGTKAASLSTYSWSNGTTTVGTTNPLTISPTATASYTVTATDANGCSITSSPAVQVTVNPLPIAPTANNSTQCGSGVPTASITDPNNFTTPTVIWYSAATAGTVLQTGTSKTYTTSISATTTFYVSVTNPATGCESPRTAVTVTVSQPDGVTAKANNVATSTAVCLNNTVALTSNQSGTNGNVYTFTWTASPQSGSGIPATPPTTGASVTVTPTAAGSYTYTVNATDGVCSAAPSSVVVTVNPLPVINSVSATPATICVGGSSVLKATSGSAAAGSATIGTQSTTEFGGGLYRYGYGTGDFRHQLLFTAAELTSAGLVAGNITSLSTNVTTVGSGSANNYTISLANTTATALTAIFQTGTFTTVYTAATYTAVSGVNTHTFSTPFVWDGTSNVLVNICYNVSTTGGSSTLAATTPSAVSNNNLLGTTGACSATSGATTYANRPLITFGGQVGTQGAGTYNWVWNPGSLSGASVTVTPTATTPYTVTATDPATGCANTSSAVTVTVNPLPTAPTATNSTQCGAGVPTASVADPNGYTTPTFKWYASNTATTPLQSSTSITYTTSINATTTFYVSVTNPTTGCESPRTAVTVTVNTPDAVTASASPASVCLGGSSTLTAVKGSGTNVYTYTWTATSSNASTAGISTNTGSSIVVTPTAAGTYTYQVSANDATSGCSTTATVNLTIGTPLSALTVTPATTSVCAGATDLLTASGGTVSTTATALSENFDGTAPGWTTTSASTASDGVTTITNVNWYLQSSPYTDNTGTATFSNFTTTQGGKFVYSTPDAGGSGSTTNTILTSPSFSLTGYTSATLTFEQGYKYWASGDQTVKLQISTNGGTSWTDLQNYLGTSAGTTTNNAQTTANVTVDLSSYVGNSNLKIRYNYVSVWGYYWIIDNVVISGQQPTQVNITWSSPTNTDLFTNSAGTTAYVQGTASSTVYAKPATSPVTYTATATSAAGCTTTATTSISINPATAIGTQPVSASYCLNATASALTVSATGTGTLTYQWYSNVTNSNSGGTSVGSANGGQTASYTPPTNAAGTKYYYVVVTASTCSSTATSNAVAVVVTAPPAITTQPSSTTQNVCQGSSATLSVVATGSNLTYQWYSNTSNSNSGGTSAGSANGGQTANYTPTVTGGTTYYYVVINGDCGSVTSNVSGAVISSSTQITTQPATTTSYCQNQTATALSVTASGSGIDYQWYSNTTNSNTGGTPILNATGRTYTPSTATVGTFYYYVTVSGDCGNVTSSVATVIVKALPTVSFGSSTASTCYGTSVSLPINGTANATVTYTVDGGSSQTTTLGSGGTGSITTSSTLGSSTSTTTHTYTLVSVSNGNGCTGVITNGTSTVTVYPLPVVASISGPDYIALTKTGSYSNTTTGGVWAITADPSNTGSTLTSTTANPTTVQAGSTNVGTITLSYTVTGTGGCTTTVTKSIQIFDNAIARYRSVQDGKASEASTWEYLNDNNIWINPSPTVPTNSSNIEIRHNVRIEDVNYDGTLQSSVSITSHTVGSATVDGTLTVYPGRYFQSQGAVNFNGKSVVLKSDATGTGAIGIMATQIANATNVQVERFTDGKPSAQASGSRRAWRLITSPVGGQTIHQSWQEGAASNVNPSPGYGTLVTGYGFSDATAAAAQGYDWTGLVYTAGIKQYQPSLTGGSWVALPSSGTNTSLQSQAAWMLFVRGDRSVSYAGTTPATLRSTGTLQQGAQSLGYTANSKFVLAGNPYASAIDFASFYSNTTNNNSALIKDQFYSWNSTIGQYGAYVLVTHDGTGANAGGYRATPAAITGIPVQENNSYRIIPSGAGFFVTPLNPSAGGTLTFREGDKLPGQVPPINPFRVVTTPRDVRELVVNLNLRDSAAAATLADGFRAMFSPDYEGSEEDNSSAKVYNFNENLNLVRGGKAHIIEARGEVKPSDTLFVKMWYVTKKAYQLQMQGDNFTSAPGIQAWLVDNYAGTKQEIALGGAVTTVDFSVTDDSLSAKSDRFMIVFRNSGAVVLPVTLTKVSASPKNGGAEVSWTVTGEVNIKGYTAEKSTDGGRTFTAVGTQQAARNNPQSAVTTYSAYDAAPVAGDNLYRIRIEAKDGTVSYSAIVKVTIGTNGSGIRITLYPNPVREGRASLSLVNLKEGAYLASVYTQGGQAVYRKKVYITLSGTTQTEELILGSQLAQGSYQIRLTDNKGNVLFADKLIIGR